MSPPPWTLFCPLKWIQPAPVFPHVTRQQSQVDQGQHVVDGVMVLGNPECPADFGSIRPGIFMSQLPNAFGRNPGFPLAPFQGVGLQRAAVFFEPAGGMFDEGPILQPGIQDFPGHGVGQGNVAAHLQTQPTVSPLGRAGSAGVDDEEPGSAVHSLQHVMKEDRVRFAGVGPPKEDEIGYPRFPGRNWCRHPSRKTVARPTTLGACQVRLQLSMLLQPMTVRTNFWAAKLSSLVVLEQLNIPNACGPLFPATFRQSPGRPGPAPRPNLPGEGRRRSSPEARSTVRLVSTP